MSLSQPIGVMGEDTMQGSHSVNWNEFAITLLQIEKPDEESLIYAETGYAFDLQRINTIFETLSNLIILIERQLANDADAYVSRKYKSLLKLDAWLSYSLETGSRQRELRSITKEGKIVGMKRTLLKDGWQHWYRGKNQNGIRKAFISRITRKKLLKMWKVCGLPANDFVFPTDCEWMRKVWNWFKNNHLGSEFHETFSTPRKSMMSECQKYSLKSFRKTHSAALFDLYWEKYNNPHMALERVQEAMGHKTLRMTWQHYAREIERVGRGHYKKILPFGLLENANKIHGQHCLQMYE